MQGVDGKQAQETAGNTGGGFWLLATGLQCREGARTLCELWSPKEMLLTASKTKLRDRVEGLLGSHRVS